MAVTQQLSISLGVAISAAVLRSYPEYRGLNHRSVPLYLYYHGCDYGDICADVPAAAAERWPQPNKRKALASHRAANHQLGRQLHTLLFLPGLGDTMNQHINRQLAGSSFGW